MDNSYLTHQHGSNVYGDGDHRLSRSFSNFVGKIKKKNKNVPALDFSNLK